MTPPEDVTGLLSEVFTEFANLSVKGALQKGKGEQVSADIKNQMALQIERIAERITAAKAEGKRELLAEMKVKLADKTFHSSGQKWRGHEFLDQCANQLLNPQREE